MFDLEITWDGLDKAFAELEAECTNIVRGITVEIFRNTLNMSPQFFGRYVSSWTYSLNEPLFISSDRFDYVAEDQGYARITQKGDAEAIDFARSNNAGRESGFKLGDTVFISNGVNHGEGPYAQGIEDGSIRLRAANQPGAPVSRSIDRAGAWYGNEVHHKHVEELKAMRIY